MTESINWTFNVQVVGGPTVKQNGRIPTEAYQKSQIKIEPAATPVVINVPEAAQMLVVIASTYPDPTVEDETLTYIINGGAPETEIAFNAPLLLFGQGAVGQFAKDLVSLTFASTLPEAVTIDILTATDPTP